MKADKNYFDQCGIFNFPKSGGQESTARRSSPSPGICAQSDFTIRLTGNIQKHPFRRSR
jgi:hypothetical protein